MKNLLFLSFLSLIIIFSISSCTRYVMVMPASGVAQAVVQPRVVPQQRVVHGGQARFSASVVAGGQFSQGPVVMNGRVIQGAGHVAVNVGNPMIMYVQQPRVVYPQQGGYYGQPIIHPQQGGYYYPQQPYNQPRPAWYYTR